MNTVLEDDNTSADEAGAPKIRRLNKLPIYLFVGLVIVFGVVVIYGLATRGLHSSTAVNEDAGGQSASDFAERLKQGVSNGVIGAPQQAAPVIPVEPTPQPPAAKPFTNPFQENPDQTQNQGIIKPQETELDWRKRLARQQEEQELQEKHRQKMKRLQSADAALDSPIIINLAKNTVGYPAGTNGAANPARASTAGNAPSTADLYAAAMQAARGGKAGTDANGQAAKEDFFNKNINDAGYLGNQLVPQISPYELKRGSVIPATLISGINSDLPGRITAQVRENVYDSATGHRLLIPQGAKLFGRYDSKVSFGQSRVLVVWTDLIFPNGATLQIGNMAGVDGQGMGGFHDKVNNHYFKTFGSAVLLAIIGTGIDMAVSQSSTLATQQTASDAARRNFADTFGKIAEKTISKNLNVQPTLEIRPGYNFNILVDQDIVLPGSYQG